MPVVAWSRSLDEAARARPTASSAPPRPSSSPAAPTWSACTSRSTAETRGLLGDGLLRRAQAGRHLHQHRARRGRRRGRARARRAREGPPRRHRRPARRARRRHRHHLGAAPLGADVYGTHHVGASTRQAESAIADEAVRIVASFVTSGEVPNCVNLYAPGAGRLAARRPSPRPGRRPRQRARLAPPARDQRRGDGKPDLRRRQDAANAANIERAACCTMRLASPPPPECLRRFGAAPTRCYTQSSLQWAPNSHVVRTLRNRVILTADSSSPMARDTLSLEAMAGTILEDKYRLIRVLGSGAMAHVYEAEQIRLGRSVAVKIMRVALVSDKRSVERFRTEALAASRINHPNAIAIYDVGVTKDGRPVHGDGAPARHDAGAGARRPAVRRRAHRLGRRRRSCPRSRKRTAAASSTAISRARTSSSSRAATAPTS